MKREITKTHVITRKELIDILAGYFGSYQNSNPQLDFWVTDGTPKKYVFEEKEEVDE